MTRARESHPPTLLTLVQRELRSLGVPSRGDVVLVAVSGGPDSQALLHVMARLGRRFGFSVEACGLDHGLRASAPDELELAALLARALDVPFHTERLGLEPGANVMERARSARYDALRNAARQIGARWIAVGHHADDRAETVLMRLMRGTGPAGLAVFAGPNGNVIRPMIRARRSDVLSHLARHGIEFAQDPTNQDRKYLRSVVRHEVLPLLERFSPRITEHLCDLADDLGALGLEPSRGLTRAHLRGLARAGSGGGREVRVALPGGRVARLDPGTGRVVVEPSSGSQLSRSHNPHDPDAR